MVSISCTRREVKGCHLVIKGTGACPGSRHTSLQVQVCVCVEGTCVEGTGVCVCVEGTGVCVCVCRGVWRVRVCMEGTTCVEGTTCMEGTCVQSTTCVEGTCVEGTTCVDRRVYYMCGGTCE